MTTRAVRGCGASIRPVCLFLTRGYDNSLVRQQERNGVTLRLVLTFPAWARNRRAVNVALISVRGHSAVRLLVSRIGNSELRLGLLLIQNMYFDLLFLRLSE